MIKAAIFDVDGVIIVSNSSRFSYKIFSQRIADEYGASPESLSQFFNEVFPKCLVGKADLKNEIQPYLKEWNWNDDVDSLLDYWFRNESNIDKRVLEIVQQLKDKGIKCYLGTNQEKYRIEYLRNQLGLGDIFENIFSSAYIRHRKNEPQFFEYVLEKLRDIKPAELLFIDDSKDNIENAKNLGIQAYLYQNFEDFQVYLTQILDGAKSGT